MIHFAAEKGNLKEQELDKCVHVDVTDKLSWTPLLCAAHNSQFEAMSSSFLAKQTLMRKMAMAGLR